MDLKFSLTVGISKSCISVLPTLSASGLKICKSPRFRHVHHSTHHDDGDEQLHPPYMSPTSCPIITPSFLSRVVRHRQAFVVGRVRLPQRKRLHEVQSQRSLSTTVDPKPGSSQQLKHRLEAKDIGLRVIANTTREEDATVLKSLLEAHERLQRDEGGEKCRVVGTCKSLVRRGR